AARHRDAIRPDQLVRVVIALVGIEAIRVPVLRRLLVEGRVRKQPEADDAGGLAVVRGLVDVLAARADGDAGILLRVLERIRRAVSRAVIEPEAVAIRI